MARAPAGWWPRSWWLVVVRIVALSGAGVALVWLGGDSDGRGDVRTAAVGPRTRPSHAYGLDANDLPVGYQASEVGAVTSDPVTAEELDGSVGADVYRADGVAPAVVLTGPSDALESFLPAADSTSLTLAGGAVGETYQDFDPPGRIAIGVRGGHDHPLTAVVLATTEDVTSLVPLAAAATEPADDRPGELLATGQVDALGGLIPAALVTYRSQLGDDELVIGTMSSGTLDPVIRHVVPALEDVAIGGAPGLAFSGHDAREFVAWRPPEGGVVIMAGPATLGRATLVELAQRARAIEPVVVPDVGSEAPDAG